MCIVTAYRTDVLARGLSDLEHGDDPHGRAFAELYEGSSLEGPLGDLLEGDHLDLDFDPEEVLQALANGVNPRLLKLAMSMGVDLIALERVLFKFCVAQDLLESALRLNVVDVDSFNNRSRYEEQPGCFAAALETVVEHASFGRGLSAHNRVFSRVFGETAVLSAC